MRRIVVTGMGAVTPLAANVEASWSRLLAGRSGIRRLPDDVVADLPAKVGGAVPSLEDDPESRGEETGLRRKDDGGRLKHLDIGRENYRSRSSTPRAARKRDSAEGTMGVRLTIEAPMIS
jgi:3-oxoacyl-(acyl-carrier-protein) synthase